MSLSNAWTDRVGGDLTLCGVVVGETESSKDPPAGLFVLRTH